MYTVAKGPTNLLQKSRLGLKSVEQESRHDSSDRLGQSDPADRLGQFAEVPHFQSPQERKSQSQDAKKTQDSRRSKKRRGGGEDKPVSDPQQDVNTTKTSTIENKEAEHYRELVTFLDQTWSQIRTEMETDCESVKYFEQTKITQNPDFKPFNLDMWMEQKIYNSIMAGI